MINNIFMSDKNITMSVPEWEALRDDLFGWAYKITGTSIPNVSSNNINEVFGKKVFIRNETVILWGRCEYCGKKEITKGLNGYYICASCSAPI